MATRETYGGQVSSDDMIAIIGKMSGPEFVAMLRSIANQERKMFGRLICSCVNAIDVYYIACYYICCRYSFCTLKEGYMEGPLFQFCVAVNSNKYPSFYGLPGDERDIARAVIEDAIEASSISALSLKIVSAIIDKFYSYVDIKDLAYELAHALTMWDSNVCLKSAPSVIRDNVCANQVLSFTDDVAFAIDDMSPKDFGILLNLISQGKIVCTNKIYAHRFLSYAQRYDGLRDTSILAMMGSCIN